MKKLPFVIVLLVFLYSCNENRSNKFNGEIIQRDTFVVVLAELQIADAIQAHYALNQKPSPVNQGLLYLSILKKHNIERESFRKTIAYYSSNMDDFEIVYEEVYNYLISEQDKLGKPDSVKSGN